MRHLTAESWLALEGFRSASSAPTGAYQGVRLYTLCGLIWTNNKHKTEDFISTEPANCMACVAFNPTSVPHVVIEEP